jgi:hypothetical protein
MLKLSERCTHRPWFRPRCSKTFIQGALCSIWFPFTLEGLGFIITRTWKRWYVPRRSVVAGLRPTCTVYKFFLRTWAHFWFRGALFALRAELPMDWMTGAPKPTSWTLGPALAAAVHTVQHSTGYVADALTWAVWCTHSLSLPWKTVRRGEGRVARFVNEAH